MSFFPPILPIASSMPEPARPKLLIVGWDAADWKIIDPLFQLGALPNLKTLLDRGIRSDLSTLDPMLSPLLWTSIATGKTPDKHGILNFIEPDPDTGTLRPASSTTRRTKALWNILSQQNLRTILVSWYATHPAEPIRGSCISNLFQEGQPKSPEDPWPTPPGAVHPADQTDAIADLRLHPGELAGDELLTFLPALRTMDPSDRRIALLAKLVAQCASVHNAATALMAQEPWDCAMVFYEAIDVAGHHFMQYHPPRMAHVPERDFENYQYVVRGMYQLQDLMLGSLLDLAGPDAAVILLSDHGFHSDHLRPSSPPSPDDAHAAMDASWHRPLGILAMAGPGLKRGEQIYGANILDIAPTALTILGLPVGADMDGRVLVESFQSPPAIERVFSWDDLEGDSGMHPAGMRQDPFEARDAMEQLAALGYINAPTGDARAQLDLLARETRFNLAICYSTTRRVRDALPLFEQLVAEAPGEPRYAMNLAQCYYNSGRYTMARQVLDGIIAAEPANASARVHLGAALFAEGKLEEASAVLEQAERDFPGRTDLDTILGTIYIYLRRWDDAERVFTRAAAADPHEPRAHHGLALVAIGRGKHEQAVDHCLRALELRHFYPDAHYSLGVALTWMKDFDHAIKSFNVALSMQPGLIDAHRYLASIYRHLGDGRNAPIHRDMALHFINQRSRGEAGHDQLRREAPMGPQEWLAHIGQSDDDRAAPDTAAGPAAQ